MGLGLQIVPVTAFSQNASLVWCDESHAAALIDPGGDVDRLTSAVSAAAVDLRAVWLTHGHLDHAGAAREIADRYGVPVIGPHRDDAFWLERLAEQGAMFGFPPAQPLTPDRWLDDGDVLELGALRFDVLHTPGHTPGHVVLFAASARRAFVGDVLFRGSIGRTDFPRGDAAQLLRSIYECLLPLGDDVVIVPGHGPESTLGFERRHNPHLQVGTA